MTTSGNIQRLRIVFRKGVEIRHISHLDLARALERAFRRADLPLVYSQGFNPRPRFAIGSALPVGVTGRAEVMDLWLSPPLAPAEVVSRLAPQSPKGLEFVAAQEVDPRLPALQAAMRWAEYEVTLTEPMQDLAERVAQFLRQKAVLRERTQKGSVRQYDLRPLIADIWIIAADGKRLGMRLANSSQGTARADEVLAALGLEGQVEAIERTQLIWEDG